MAKIKYYYNKQSLRYEKVEERFINRLLRTFGFICAALVFALVIVLLAYNYLDSPKEKILKREISTMRLEYDLLNQKMDQMTQVMAELEERDDNIYRVVFEAEPISPAIRQAGIGGSDRYKKFASFENGELISESLEKIDGIGRRIAVQSESYDDIAKMVKDKAKLLNSIPSIMPLNDRDLTRIASGYGWRIDPHHKIKKFHYGMDFTASSGTEVHSSGDGTVELAKFSRGGYGNQVIIDHGYGFKTRYAHLSAIDVRIGQKIKKFDKIGAVGSTGKSMGPHLHYEVLKNGEAVNPIDYYYNDLNAEDYDLARELASQNNQSFD